MEPELSSPAAQKAHPNAPVEPSQVVSPSVSLDMHASRYYTAMSEPAMLSWTTGQVRRMRSVLEMRLGVLACSSLDKSSFFALSYDSSSSSSSPASASPNPLALLPRSASVTDHPEAANVPNAKGVATQCRCRRQFSQSSSSSSSSSSLGSSTFSSSSAAHNAAGSVSLHPSGAKQENIALSLPGATSTPEDAELAESSPRSIRAHAMFHLQDDECCKEDEELAAEAMRENSDDDDADVSANCELDIFGIPIPGTGGRNMRRVVSIDLNHCPHEDSTGSCEENLVQADSLEVSRRHLLPQVVTFVASSPSKLDLSGLLC